MLCAVVANAWCKRDDGRQFTARDFLLRFEQQRRQTPDDIAEKLRSITKLLGGRIEK